MDAYAGNGRLLEAWRCYRSYETRMKDELDLPPDDDVKAYFEKLVRPADS
jgi:hypothetical protein